MEILNSAIAEREGNDCLITEAIVLLRITNRAYVVTYVRDVLGGWTGNPIESNIQSFHSYDKAKTCYDTLYNRINEERLILSGGKIYDS